MFVDILSIVYEFADVLTQNAISEVSPRLATIHRAARLTHPISSKKIDTAINDRVFVDGAILQYYKINLEFNYVFMCEFEPNIEHLYKRGLVTDKDLFIYVRNVNDLAAIKLIARDAKISEHLLEHSSGSSYLINYILPRFKISEKVLNYALRNMDDDSADTINLLIDKGADVTHGNNSPLRGAIYNGCIHNVKVLLARGADANHVRRGLPSYPLRAAAINGRFEIVKLLAPLSTNHRSAARQSTFWIGILSYLINTYGLTEPEFLNELLHIAVMHGNCKAVKFLLGDRVMVNINKLQKVDIYTYGTSSPCYKTESMPANYVIFGLPNGCKADIHSGVYKHRNDHALYLNIRNIYTYYDDHIEPLPQCKHISILKILIAHGTTARNKRANILAKKIKNQEFQTLWAYI